MSQIFRFHRLPKNSAVAPTAPYSINLMNAIKAAISAAGWTLIAQDSQVSSSGSPQQNRFIFRSDGEAGDKSVYLWCRYRLGETFSPQLADGFDGVEFRVGIYKNSTLPGITSGSVSVGADWLGSGGVSGPDDSYIRVYTDAGTYLPLFLGVDKDRAVMVYHGPNNSTQFLYAGGIDQRLPGKLTHVTVAAAAGDVSIAVDDDSAFVDDRRYIIARSNAALPPASPSGEIESVFVVGHGGNFLSIPAPGLANPVPVNSAVGPDPSVAVILTDKTINYLGAGLMTGYGHITHDGSLVADSYASTSSPFYPRAYVSSDPSCAMLATAVSTVIGKRTDSVPLLPIRVSSRPFPVGLGLASPQREGGYRGILKGVFYVPPFHAGIYPGSLSTGFYTNHAATGNTNANLGVVRLGGNLYKLLPILKNNVEQGFLAVAMTGTDGAPASVVGAKTF